MTTAIVAVTVVVHLLLWLSGVSDNAIVLGGFMPGRVGVPLEGVAAVPWWLTPFSAALIHADWLHLGFNMLMLVVTGRFTEQAIGGRALLLLYVLGAAAAAASQWFAGPDDLMPMVGASGAVSAVVAVYALLYGQNRARAIGPISARWVHVLWLAGAWIAINWLVGAVSAGQGMAIAVAAHVGGFVAGLALARPLLLWRYRDA